MLYNIIPHPVVCRHISLYVPHPVVCIIGTLCCIILYHILLYIYRHVMLYKYIPHPVVCRHVPL